MSALIMGILNATPDSFYDGNPLNTTEGLLARAEQYIKEGADWLDIGGESTRPGAAPVDEKTEAARVIPLVKNLHARYPQLPLSLDTTKPLVAEEGLKNGVQLLNDVSGTTSPEMLSLAKQFNAQLVLMHARGTPQTMQTQTDYTDVVEDVKNGLANKISLALQAGLHKEQLWIDVGFGFAKTREQNYTLLKHLSRFKDLGVRMLVALSRKSFLSYPGDSPAERLPQTLAAQFSALCQGADALRVHDVTAAKRLVHFYQTWEQAI